jgi:hypothetical protein
MVNAITTDKKLTCFIQVLPHPLFSWTTLNDGNLNQSSEPMAKKHPLTLHHSQQEMNQTTIYRHVFYHKLPLNIF